MITVNDGGVLKTLGEISANDGGALRKLSTVHANDGGVLRQIFSADKPISKLKVGDIVKTKVNDRARDFIIVHQGLPSSLYDSSCDGTWLLMKNVYEKHQWNTVNVNNYADSIIHNHLNNDVLKWFDTNIQNAIKSVKLPYYSEEGTINSGANGLSAKIFLLSGYEVGWTKNTDQYMPVDGACLSYFSETATTDSKRIGYLNDSATNWWLRSPYFRAIYWAWNVGPEGSTNGGNCSFSYGVRPAFILPHTARIDKDGYITA